MRKMQFSWSILIGFADFMSEIDVIANEANQQSVTTTFEEYKPSSPPLPYTTETYEKVTEGGGTSSTK